MKLRFFAALLLIPGIVFAETTLRVGKDIVVKGQPTFDHQVEHGYAEYRFTVENHSPDRSHRVRVALEAQQQNPSLNIEKEVQVPPGEQLSFTMFANRYKNYFNMTATVDGGMGSGDGFSEINTGSFNYFGGTRTSLLASRTVNSDDLQNRIESINGWTGTGAFNNHYALRRTDLPMEEWSDNWLAYSAFDGIILYSQDFETIPPGALSALRQYAENGGTLLIVGDMELPWTGRTINRTSFDQDSKRYDIGLGRCVIHRETSTSFGWLDRIDIDSLEQARRAFPLVGEPLYEINSRFPVTDNLTMPVRGFLLLVSLFALVAGPITILLLAKMNRRIWLLWLIPLESAVACGIVLCYSFLSEGITPTVRMEGITVLDQERHQATTWGMLGYYCPQKPSGGLFFPADWEVNPITENTYTYAAPQTRYHIDWTRGQHFTKGAIEARVPSFFYVQNNAIRRERLEVIEENGRPVAVVNGLGADIEELWLRDADNRSYHVDSIRAGQRIDLPKPDVRVAFGSIADLQYLASQQFLDMQKTILKTTPERYLVPGSYIAKLSGAPFMESGLGDRKVKMTASQIVYGILPIEVQP